MKILLLVRHAKSSWDDPLLGDRDRPLNKRGKRDAPLMGALLREKGLVPDLLVSSPARRALKTAKLFAKALGYPKHAIEIQEAIYAGRLETLQALVANLDEHCSRVCLFGHNPELSELLQSLSAESSIDLPTCGMACIEFAQDTWRGCGEAKGRLAWFERPPKSPQPAV